MTKWILGLVVVVAVALLVMKDNEKTVYAPDDTSAIQSGVNEPTSINKEPVVQNAPSYTSIVKIKEVTGPASVATGLQTNWVISAEAPGTETTTYTANWADGSPKESQTSSNVFTHIYTKPGLYVITFTAKSTNSKLVQTLKTVNVVSANK